MLFVEAVFSQQHTRFNKTEQNAGRKHQGVSENIRIEEPLSDRASLKPMNSVWLYLSGYWLEHHFPTHFVGIY